MKYINLEKTGLKVSRAKTDNIVPNSLPANPQTIPDLLDRVAALNADFSIRPVEIGLELIGNPGLMRKDPLERHYRDVLCSCIHTPQNDVILSSLGKSAL
jgi:alkylation response protein AidB-like acyl-CoA dehydrogenase